MKTIKNQIERFVAMSGCTRYQISKEANVSEALLSRIKHDKQRDITLSSVNAIREAMRRLNPEAAAKVLEDHNG